MTSGSAALVVSDPEICGGQPVFAGSRVSIDVVLACVDAGNDMGRIPSAYPLITRDHIAAARAYRAANPPSEFWQEASAIAVEYGAIADLIRMSADSEDDAERLAIVMDIQELIADIKKAYP